MKLKFNLFSPPPPQDSMNLNCNPSKKGVFAFQLSLSLSPAPAVSHTLIGSISHSLTGSVSHSHRLCLTLSLSYRLGLTLKSLLPARSHTHTSDKETELSPNGPTSVFPTQSAVPNYTLTTTERLALSPLYARETVNSNTMKSGAGCVATEARVNPREKCAMSTWF